MSNNVEEYTAELVSFLRSKANKEGYQEVKNYFNTFDDILSCDHMFLLNASFQLPVETIEALRFFQDKYTCPTQILIESVNHWCLDFTNSRNDLPKNYYIENLLKLNNIKDNEEVLKSIRLEIMKNINSHDKYKNSEAIANIISSKNVYSLLKKRHKVKLKRLKLKYPELKECLVKYSIQDAIHNF
jgi:hypothetical protein